MFGKFKKRQMVNKMTAEELFEQGEVYQTQNPKKAFQYYFQAADMGDSKAMQKVAQ